MREEHRSPPFALQMPQLIELSEADRDRLYEAVISAVNDKSRYVQGEWTGDIILGYRGKIEGACDTFACIAGHACHEAVALGLAVDLPGPTLDAPAISKAARQLLGIDMLVANVLFDPDYEAYSSVGELLSELRSLQKQGQDSKAMFRLVTEKGSIIDDI